MSYQELYRGLNKIASYEEIATLATMLKQAALIKEEKSGYKIKGNILKNKQKQISRLIRGGRGGKGAEASNLVEHLQGNLKKRRPMFQNTSIQIPSGGSKVPSILPQGTDKLRGDAGVAAVGEQANKLLQTGKVIPGNSRPGDNSQTVMDLLQTRLAGRQTGVFSTKTNKQRRLDAKAGRQQAGIYVTKYQAPPEKGPSRKKLKHAEIARRKQVPTTTDFVMKGETTNGPHPEALKNVQQATILKDRAAARRQQDPQGPVADNMSLVPYTFSEAVTQSPASVPAPRRDYSKVLKALGYGGVGVGGAAAGSLGNYLLNTRPLEAENKELRNQLGTGFWDRIWKALQALFNGTSKNYVGAA